jgi:hypothetical protein
MRSLILPFLLLFLLPPPSFALTFQDIKPKSCTFLKEIQAPGDKGNIIEIAIGECEGVVYGVLQDQTIMFIDKHPDDDAIPLDIDKAFCPKDGAIPEDAKPSGEFIPFTQCKASQT